MTKRKVWNKLANKYNCTQQSIRYYLKQNGVKFRPYEPDNIPEGYKYCNG